MGQLKLVLLPLFLILTLSLAYAFADSNGDLSVVLGKTYQIHYEAKDANVQNVQANKEYLSLIFSVQATSPVATLQLTMPRELIDATKNDNTDEYFIVLVDGAFATYTEKSTNSTSRTILIQLAPENKEVEVVGTHLGAASLINQKNNAKQEIPQKQPIEQKPGKNQTNNSQSNTTKSQLTQSMTENATTSVQEQLVQRITSLLHFESGYLPFHVDKNQILEYSIIASITLVVVVAIASSARSRRRKYIRR